MAKRDWLAPRTIIAERAWYYVNRDSIDLIVREPNKATLGVRIKRHHLQKMLAMLKARKESR
jgi:hypothetical protein